MVPGSQQAKVIVQSGVCAGLGRAAQATQAIADGLTNSLLADRGHPLPRGAPGGFSTALELTLGYLWRLFYLYWRGTGHACHFGTVVA